jgi:hypothetical protein
MGVVVVFFVIKLRLLNTYFPVPLCQIYMINHPSRFQYVSPISVANIFGNWYMVLISC